MSPEEKPLSESFTPAELFLGGFTLGVLAMAVAVGALLAHLQHTQPPL